MGVDRRSAMVRIVPFRLTRWPYWVSLAAWVFAVPIVWMESESLFRWFYITPHLISLTHFLILGFATTIALASLNQLIPIVFEVAAAPGPWVALGTWTYLAGLPVLLAGAWWWHTLWLGVGGMIVLLGTALWLLHHACTLAQTPDKRQPEFPFVVAAMFHLVLTMVVGVLMALSMSGALSLGIQRLFPLHLWLGGVGWFMALFIGISYKLLGLFGLSAKKRPELHRSTFLVMMMGLWSGILCTLLAWPAWPSLIVLALAGAIHLTDIVRMGFKAKGKRPEVTLGYIRVGQVCLGLGLLLLVLLSLGIVPGRLGSLAALLLLPGWLLAGVAGYLHKILPFLEWNTRYYGWRDGPPPSLKGMLDRRWAWWGWGFYEAGVFLAAVALLGDVAATQIAPWQRLFQTGVGLWGVGVVVTAINLALVFFRHPKPAWVPGQFPDAKKGGKSPS